jgi:hypothetical protein
MPFAARQTVMSPSSLGLIAGTDGSELLIITNQPDTRPTVESEMDGGVEGQSVGHPSFVDDDQRRRSDGGGPVR